MAIIFISHAEADKPVIDDFFDLLQMGCDLKRKEIFCTSVDDAGIETGQDFVDWIQSNLVDSKLVVLFLTPNYYASRFCVAEMGAAWAHKKDVFPLVIPGIDRDAGSVMLGRQTAVVDESGLDDLRDRIAKHYHSASKATTRWNLKKEKFLKKFREKVSQLPKPALLDKELLEGEKERTSEAMKMNEQLTKEIKILREQITLLEKAKDAEEVKEIKKKFEIEEEQYQELVKAASKELKKLTRVEVRCLYAFIIREPWIPARETWDYFGKDIERALQSAWIEEKSTMSEEDAYIINSEHPKMKSVLAATFELDEFITKIPAETISRMEEEQGYIIRLSNREFWEEELTENSLLD